MFAENVIKNFVNDLRGQDTMSEVTKYRVYSDAADRPTTVHVWGLNDRGETISTATNYDLLQDFASDAEIRGSLGLEKSGS